MHVIFGIRVLPLLQNSDPNQRVFRTVRAMKKKGNFVFNLIGSTKKARAAYP